MLWIRPDFYDRFHCIAAACRHSCCVGWEIDVDEDSLQYYQDLEGPLGDELRRQIEPVPTPHFRLSKDERCPFLRSDGLCRLICELGEDSLCDICALHPRFYNEYPDRTEAGLGLCCEETVRLLTEESGPLCLLSESDGEGDETPTPLLLRREEIFALLADDARSLTERMDSALALMGQRLPEFNGKESAAFFLTLERMDESWTALLEKLSAENVPEPEPRLSTWRYARIAAYLVYRHFASASSEAEAALRLQFCFHAVRLICVLETYSADALRLFSAEIEYSDENVKKICSWLAKR